MTFLQIATKSDLAAESLCFFFLFYSVLCSGRHAGIKHAQDVTISLIKHAQNKYGERVPSMKINY